MRSPRAVALPGETGAERWESTYGSGSGGECAEAAALASGSAVRGSKHPDRGHLVLPRLGAGRLPLGDRSALIGSEPLRPRARPGSPQDRDGLPQHFLYLRDDPHQHGALRGGGQAWDLPWRAISAP